MIRAAQVDAQRLLAEQLKGVLVYSKTEVTDLNLSKDAVVTAMKGALTGARMGNPRFYPDGRVEVDAKLHLADVIKTFQGDTLIDEEMIRTTISATGNSAIPGSKGEARVQARRAAQVDAYRQLAARILGVSISSESTVKDFVLQSDRVVNRLAHLIRSARTDDVVYFDDGSAETTISVSKYDIILMLKDADLEGFSYPEIAPRHRDTRVSASGVGVGGGDSISTGQDNTPSDPTTGSADTLILIVMESLAPAAP
jgi:hypothetical protein